MRHRTKWGKNRNEGLSIGSVSDKDRGVLNVTKTLNNAKRVGSAKFGNEAHCLCLTQSPY